MKKKIKFRQKDFTIQSGKYEGPKDLEKVPGYIKVVGNTALTGAGIGAVIGSVSEKTSISDGAKKGAKYGIIAGVALKLLLNHLHNPMNKVKYQEVDKAIRKEFGVFNISGVVIGDTLSKRATIEEKFGFNDVEITEYKVNFCIQDDKVTIYTLGMTDEELNKTSNILDYYCKKYTGMNYNSFLINSKTNSYSISVQFTNYKVISEFLLELSSILNSKINLLNNKIAIESRLSLFEKEFSSVKTLNKYDIMKILGRTGTFVIPNQLVQINNNKKTLSSAVMGLVLSSLYKLSGDLITSDPNIATKSPFREMFSNVYLENTLKKFHYVEKFDYSVGESVAEVNISMNSGTFIITVPKNSKSQTKIEKEVWNKYRSLINRTDTGNVILYSYVINSKSEFEMILKKLMSCKVEPNIFEK